MVPNHYSLTWDSYKSSVCSGFSSLQQNGEFVDMTLAADGHLVKVHQILIALASPYLKDLINSVPAPHPVIFLNNVPHTILAMLLEYIYTGEVMVPAEQLQSFMDAAKALHIRGLETISSSYYTNVKVSHNDQESAVLTKVKKGIPLDIQSVQTSYDLPTAAMKVSVREPPIRHIVNVKPDVDSKEEYHTYSDLDDGTVDVASDSENHSHMDTSQMSNDAMTTTQTRGKEKTDDPDEKLVEQFDSTKKTYAPEKVSSNNLQFTVSIRGSLQVILNRYIYNLQSVSQHSGIRRWRCTDYRNRKCPASLITKGSIVLKRSCLHSHSFHDKKILSKIEKNAVYSALDDVEGYRDKEKHKTDDEEWHMDTPASLDCSSDASENAKCKN